MVRFEGLLNGNDEYFQLVILSDLFATYFSIISTAILGDTWGVLFLKFMRGHQFNIRNVNNGTKRNKSRINLHDFIFHVHTQETARMKQHAWNSTHETARRNSTHETTRMK